MGVQGLNAIIKKTPKELPRKYKRIVIDGSNLVFNKLSSSVSQLKKRFPINEWGSIDKDLLFQTSYIINSTVREIVRFVNDCKRNYNAERIYIVMDPSADEMFYSVNLDMEFVNEVETINIEELEELEELEEPEEDLTDDPLKTVNEKNITIHSTNVLKTSKLRDNPFITSIFGLDEINDNITVEFNIKAEEQVKRQLQQDKEKLIELEIRKLKSLNIDSDFQFMITSIYRQSYHYLVVPEMLKLKQLVLLLVEQECEGKNIFIVDAHCEADLAIKSIVNDNVESFPVSETFSTDYTLIISADTDYYVIFSDSPRVHCRDILDKDVYSPYRCWKCFFGEAYSYDVVIRSSALFGNDYTTHKRIINAKDYSEDMKCLFNIDMEHRLKTLSFNSRKTIFGVVNGFVKEFEETYGKYEPTPVTFVDYMIHEYDIEYFRKYFISTIIYKNWKIYNNCTIRETENLSEKIVEEYDKLFEHLYELHQSIFRWKDIMKLFSNSEEFIYGIDENYYENAMEMKCAFSGVKYNAIEEQTTDLVSNDCGDAASFL